ncbi:MAG: HEAT repeat domain-containing protein [Deltaproteobacteria bacterium]|jgi:HEAT repeat protein|nr:HEAT repeat domain-containing protein [Deltaproteobacteria bacterium]
MQEDVKRIQELLESNAPEAIREGAYLAMHNGSHDLVPLLVKNIEFPNPGVQEAVDAALRKIGGQVVLFSVLPLLRSEDTAIRNIAMDLLRDVARSDVMALAELMKDDDADIRIFGSDILGSSGSALAVPPLAHALLRDPETNVRYQAAVSLGELGFPEAAESLGMALKDEEWVQFAVIEALTKLGDESSVAPLLQALDKSTELVASSIVDALGKLGYIKAVPLLIRALPGASVPLANKIVCAIVNIVGPRSLSLLGPNEYDRMRGYFFTALEDEDEDVQDAAISGLASSKGDDEFAAIFKVLAGLNPDRHHERMVGLVKTLSGMGYHDELAKCLKSGDETTAFLSMDIISHMSDPAIMPLIKETFWKAQRDLQRAMISVAAAQGGVADRDFFLEVLERHKDGTTLKSVLYYLGKLGDESLIFEKVLPQLDHPYNDVKEAALDASVAMGSAAVNARFQEMAKDESEMHRMMAFYALGRYGLKGNLPFLAEGMKDVSPEVRRVAVEALCGKGSDAENRQAVGLLEACLDDESVEVRLAAVNSLGACREPEAVDLLLKAIRDADPWVQARAAEALGGKQLDAVAPQLAELLNSSETLVVVKTIDALRNIGGDVAFQYLLSLVNHPDPEVQNAAETAMEQIRAQSGSSA